jgi:decaprenylphospho-beta-D-ribofuranose 2-oxidase
MPVWASKELSGWGRVLRATSPTARPERIADLERALADVGDDSLLAYGAGRSYGDAALNSMGRSIVMRRLDRFLDFDQASGRLVAEAGATFADVVAVFMPRGFIAPVAPGTGFATLGGGVANDVHGKNHHQAGSLAQHVEWLDLRLPGGELRRVEPRRDVGLFKATVGGVGLTGIVERLCLRLKPVPSNAVLVRTRRIRNLDAFLEAFIEERDRSEYVVGWIDALARGRELGRGVLEAASPSAEGVPRQRRKAWCVPVDLPGFALNPLSVRAFNSAYYARVPQQGREQRQSYERFLFPLDAVHDWNRFYGKRGFHQFQCVVPFEAGRAALVAMLELTSRAGRGSFLAVLKALGPAGTGYLSFPQPGYTLALDFPNARGASELIDRLQQIACDHGGRVYLAKDSNLRPEDLRLMYPELAKFQEVLAEIDPHGRMQSDLARRLRLREFLR